MDEKKVKPMSLGTASSMTFAVLVIPPPLERYSRSRVGHTKNGHSDFGLRTFW